VRDRGPGQVAALRSLLRSARRVTVTGPPRSGKSALAAAAGSAARADFPDGVWTVPLGAVTDGALVTHVVARSLRLPDRLGLSQLAALRTGLHGQRLLIILDDCDRVAQACASLAGELARSPGVHLAATAIAPLRVADERVYATGGQRPAAPWPWPGRAAAGPAHQQYRLLPATREYGAAMLREIGEEGHLKPR
jgi:non-specific serine/threonine protein kinase